MRLIENKSITLYPDIQLTSFGKETILFHAGTGDTILLHPHAACLIRLLKTSMASVAVADLMENMAADLGFDLDEDFSTHTTALLAELINQEVISLS